MKKVLVLAVVGTALFVGTVLGLLAAQGRLNHAGTRGIPLLSALFPAPPTAAESAAQGGAAAPAPAAAPHDEPAGPAAAGKRSDGLGKEEPLPYRQGQSLFKGEAPPTGGDHAAAPPAAGDHPNGNAPGGAPADHRVEGGGKETEPAGTEDHAAAAAAGHDTPQRREGSAEWRAKVDSVLGQGQYHPGRLWSFPQIETGIGVDELNQILLRARQQQVDLERDRAAVQKQQAELEARERDVADRQDAVLEKLREIEQLRANLQSEIDEFHNTVLLIRQDEVAGLQSVAKTLAAVEPKSAAAIIKKWWETDEGQTRALKIWTVMEPDPAHAILDQLDVELIRQVLEKRLKVAREQAKAKK